MSKSSTQELKDCPFPDCRGEARAADRGPWDETGYTHCLNSGCPAVGRDGSPWRVPIPLWQQLPRGEEAMLECYADSMSGHELVAPACKAAGAVARPHESLFEYATRAVELGAFLLSEARDEVNRLHRDYLAETSTSNKYKDRAEAAEAEVRRVREVLTRGQSEANELAQMEYNGDTPALVRLEATVKNAIKARASGCICEGTYTPFCNAHVPGDPDCPPKPEKPDA